MKKTVNREQEGQALSKFVKEKNGVFYVQSSRPGAYYRFDKETSTCICPDRVFRNTSCKHEIALMIYLKSKDHVEQYNAVLDFIIKCGGRVNYTTLLKEFGDSVSNAIDALKRHNEVFEKSGYISIM